MRISRVVETLEEIEDQIKWAKEQIAELKKREEIRRVKCADPNITKEQIKAIKDAVALVFKITNNRHVIEKNLENIGFRLWAEIQDEYGRPNSDEQVWALDRPEDIPNAQILLLVNWTWGFYWIYVKTERGEF